MTTILGIIGFTTCCVIVYGVYKITSILITFLQKEDPVYKCELYKKEGCSHVDGYLCDFKTCQMRKDYEQRRNNE